MKRNKILYTALIIFLVYACVKDEIVERDSLEPSLVKAWYDSETSTHSPNFISKKEIKWDWEEAERTPNSLLIQSVESKDIRSFYKLEVSAVDGYEAVIYMYNPTAPSIDGSFTGREIAFGLGGEIIYSKFLQGTEGTQKAISKRGLLATAARFSEGSNCNPGDWCFDDDLNSFVLDEVVVTFNRSSLNNANSITSIGWSSVLNYINSYPSSTNHYGSMPTYYSSGGGGQYKANIGASAPPPSPPDCESFNFVRKGTLNYQYSYVKGIRTLMITKDGHKVYLRYDNSIEFGAPYKDRFNNIYRPGYLAEASARALKDAMDDTFSIIKTYPNIPQEMAERIFESKLVEVYPDHIPGGRVVIRPLSLNGHTPTDYKAAFFGTGNCD